jgi:hypothetical protein
MGETKTKHYRGNVLSISVSPDMPIIEQVRVKCYPCGGFNRLMCFATAAEVRHQLVRAKL